MSPDRFGKFVSALVTQLNSFGYSLKSPVMARLLNLFRRIQNKESVIEGW